MASQVNRNIRGYELGEIQAEGAFTSELQIGGPPMPLQAAIDHQYLDSKVLSKRPGMQFKYLPYRYDEINGQLLTGGSYLFDTYENAQKFNDWTSNEFELEGQKINLWAQPMWASSAHWTWKVIGACNFAPVEEHAIGRHQRWRYSGSDPETALKEAYSALKSAAKGQGAAAIWLLYQPDEKMVCVQLAFKSKEHKHSSTKEALKGTEQSTSLKSKLPKDLELQPLFDRTSLILTCWLPKSREAGGTELAIPNYPLVPGITHEHL